MRIVFALFPHFPDPERVSLENDFQRRFAGCDFLTKKEALAWLEGDEDREVDGVIVLLGVPDRGLVYVPFLSRLMRYCKENRISLAVVVSAPKSEERLTLVRRLCDDYRYPFLSLVDDGWQSQPQRVISFLPQC